ILRTPVGFCRSLALTHAASRSFLPDLGFGVAAQHSLGDGIHDWVDCPYDALTGRGTLADLARAGRAPLSRSLDVLLFERGHAGLESLDELGIAVGADHAIELRAVVGDEAQVLDEDVVGEPAVSLEGEPRLHGDLRPLGGDDARTHHRLVAADLLVHVVE